MRRRYTLTGIYFLLLITCYTAQSQGISFSYLIPKNGYISAPVSPFSLRGVGIGSPIGLETGITLYNVPGLAMTKLPFSYDKPLVGPHFAILAPVDGFIEFSMGKYTKIKLTGGAFFWWNINTRINEGNMDRAFRDYEGWDVLNSDFELEDKIAIGWSAGTQFEFEINRKFSLTSEVRYLKGTSKSTLKGPYYGGTINNTIESRTIDLDTRILIEGLELSFGAKF